MMKAFSVARFFVASPLFSATRFCLVTGTIVPIPVVGVPVFLWKAAGFLFAVKCGRGGFRRRCTMSFCVARNYWRQVQNAFSEKYIRILGLTGSFWTGGQVFVF